MNDATLGMHATLVQLAGCGVLLTGSAGMGKSQLALELIQQGHALVADDHVVISPGAHYPLGQGPEPGWGFLTVYGLGVLDIQRLYGSQAFQQQAQIHLLVNLLADITTPANHLQGHWQWRTLCGVPLAELSLQAHRPGLATLVDVAVQDWQLRAQGYRAHEALEARLGAEGP